MLLSQMGLGLNSALLQTSSALSYGWAFCFEELLTGTTVSIFMEQRWRHACNCKNLVYQNCHCFRIQSFSLSNMLLIKENMITSEFQAGDFAVC